MGIFSWIILGLIAGALAKLILPGKQGGGIIVTIILGVVGAFLGGLVVSAGWGYRAPAIVGAVLAVLGLAIALISGRLDAAEHGRKRRGTP